MEQLKAWYRNILIDNGKVFMTHQDFQFINPPPISLYSLVPSCLQFLPYPVWLPQFKWLSWKSPWFLCTSLISFIWQSLWTGRELNHLPVCFALMIYSAASKLPNNLPMCLYYLTPRRIPPSVLQTSYPLPVLLDVLATLHAGDRSWALLPFRNALPWAAITPPLSAFPFPILTDPF